MIDWSKYPVLSMYRSGSMDVREELDRIRSDVQRAERERCAEKCRSKCGKMKNHADAIHNQACDICASAIEAMGDDDG